MNTNTNTDGIYYLTDPKAAEALGIFTPERQARREAAEAAWQAERARVGAVVQTCTGCGFQAPWGHETAWCCGDWAADGQPDYLRCRNCCECS